ncbi:MAG: bifunctional adenosylcobinamide kinase/adenosylcobinamide-phosphate guanylyltransferase [Nitrospirota bacterium]
MNKKIIFILGGARSGKSAFALKEATRVSGKKAYIATAEVLDEEMRQRIEEHKRKRDDEWVTYEEPIRIDNIIKGIENRYSVIVIDCMTLWLSNLMHNGLNIEDEIKHLISSLVAHNLSLLYVVSNEVGMDIVPDNELGRRFRDMAGILNQMIAEISNEVYFVMAGIPMKIK